MGDKGQKRRRTRNRASVSRSVMMSMSCDDDEVTKDTKMSAETVEVAQPKVNVKLTHAFLTKTLSRGIKEIVAEFRGEKRTNDWTKMTVFRQQNAEGRNRYKDVGCLDKQRVELTLGPVAYIHANYVEGHDNPKKFICTQAPIPKTIADFWYMVVQEDIKCIVMLCNHVEQGAQKCADYFPVNVTKAIDAGGDVTVNAVKMGKFKFKHDTKAQIARTLLRVQVPGKKPHLCHHYHWRDWPDRGVPAADLAPIELCQGFNRSFDKYKTPIVVHCSAGIGRTGSIVLIDYLMELLKHNVTWEPDLLKYLKKLRSQRNNSVQTEHQYLYVHQVMVNYVVNHLMSAKERSDQPELMTRFEKFTKEYTAYCSGF